MNFLLLFVDVIFDLVSQNGRGIELDLRSKLHQREDTRC